MKQLAYTLQNIPPGYILIGIIIVVCIFVGFVIMPTMWKEYKKSQNESEENEDPNSPF